jgi:hypothetical protein
MKNLDLVVLIRDIKLEFFEITKNFKRAGLEQKKEKQDKTDPFLKHLAKPEKLKSGAEEFFVFESELIPHIN